MKTKNSENRNGAPSYFFLLRIHYSSLERIAYSIERASL